jgi:hypothetical protein
MSLHHAHGSMECRASRSRELGGGEIVSTPEKAHLRHGMHASERRLLSETCTSPQVSSSSPGQSGEGMPSIFPVEAT